VQTFAGCQTIITVIITVITAVAGDTERRLSERKKNNNKNAKSLKNE
jgi:hypothetical protein